MSKRDEFSEHPQNSSAQLQTLTPMEGERGQALLGCDFLAEKPWLGIHQVKSLLGGGQHSPRSGVSLSCPILSCPPSAPSLAVPPYLVGEPVEAHGLEVQVRLEQLQVAVVHLLQKTQTFWGSSDGHKP